jgi:hypothetical protein
MQFYVISVQNIYLKFIVMPFLFRMYRFSEVIYAKATAFYLAKIILRETRLGLTRQYQSSESETDTRLAHVSSRLAATLAVYGAWFTKHSRPLQAPSSG